MAPSSRCGLQQVNSDIHNSGHVAYLWSIGVVFFASASFVELAIPVRVWTGSSGKGLHSILEMGSRKTRRSELKAILGEVFRTNGA